MGLREYSRARVRTAGLRDGSNLGLGHGLVGLRDGSGLGRTNGG